MSVVPIHCKIPYREQTPQIQRSTKHSERGFVFAVSGSENRRRSFSGFDSQSRTLRYCSSESQTVEKRRKSLSYGKTSTNCSSSSMEETTMNSGQRNAEKELEILDSYLGKLDKVNHDEIQIEDSSKAKESDAVEETNRVSYMKQSSAEIYSPKSSETLEQNDETSDLYLISVLASINIGVILFELASPVRSSEVELSTIPLLYGAKVNHLIMVGEWWRLLTPMFLHSGAFHIALSCWSLLTFGPKVCKGYGWFTFLLIYILGGVSGNLISFLHTPNPTVGGTGPVYAIIGAWLIYQLQNKDVIPKDVSESMFQKAIIATGVGLILCHFCPIDEWSHFGSVFTGVAFGYLTCPTLEVGESGGEEGIALVKRQSNPRKSLILFSVFILALSCLLFFVDPPLNDLLFESFLQRTLLG